jgi:hypothetical protein
VLLIKSAVESTTATSGDTSESLGQIEVQLYYVKNIRKSNNRIDKISSLASSQKAISEKHAVKKSLSHHIRSSCYLSLYMLAWSNPLLA